MEPTKTILVVEDDSLLVELIRNKLQNHGFNVFSCPSGKEAIDYLSSIVSLPNAIWLDFYLSDMNGDKLLTEILHHESWRDIPIVIVSNSSDGHNVDLAFSLGAKKYLLKTQYELGDIVQEIIKITSQ